MKPLTLELIKKIYVAILNKNFRPSIIDNEISVYHNIYNKIYWVIRYNQWVLKKDWENSRL